jgi:5-methylcytosine-specific restriction protein A
VQRILVNRYERDQRAREKCIERYGARCDLCNFDFEAVYGSAMAGFIQVHHLKPLSDVGTEYQVDPVRDLRPVCPNCHAVLHHREPPYSLDEVRQFLAQVSHKQR